MLELRLYLTVFLQNCGLAGVEARLTVEGPDPDRALKRPERVVLGVGGIACAEDVLEFVLVGASAVEVGTASFMRPDAAFRIVQDLPRAMEAFARDKGLYPRYRGTIRLLVLKKGRLMAAKDYLTNNLFKH